MKRLTAIALLAAGVTVFALNCDRIGYEAAAGAIILMTGLCMGYCLPGKEEAK